MTTRSTDSPNSAPATTPLSAIEWRWKSFDDLSNAEVYDMLAARTAVFVIEQQCLYDDVDGLDIGAWHLFAYGRESDNGGDADNAMGGSSLPKLAGYLRVLLPVEAVQNEAVQSEPGELADHKPASEEHIAHPHPDAEHEVDIRIGRVLTTAGFRGIGLGNAMLERAIAHIRAQWPGVPIRLHAQAHLQKFYGAFGFEAISDVHEEDGIPHVWMRAA